MTVFVLFQEPRYLGDESFVGVYDSVETIKAHYPHIRWQAMLMDEADGPTLYGSNDFYFYRVLKYQVRSLVDLKT